MHVHYVKKDKNRYMVTFALACIYMYINVIVEPRDLYLLLSILLKAFPVSRRSLIMAYMTCSWESNRIIS